MKAIARKYGKCWTSNIITLKLSKMPNCIPLIKALKKLALIQPLIQYPKLNLMSNFSTGAIKAVETMALDKSHHILSVVKSANHEKTGRLISVIAIVKIIQSRKKLKRLKIGRVRLSRFGFSFIRYFYTFITYSFSKYTKLSKIKNRIQ